MWGGHAVVGKAVESQMSPLSLALWRFTFSSICYLPLLRGYSRVFRLPLRSKLQLAFTALCWSVLYPLFYYRSLHYITPVESLLLVNTSPIIAAGISWLLYRERLARMEWIGILVSFLGVVVLVRGQWHGSGILTGSIFALIGAVAFAGYTVASRKLFQSLPLFDVLQMTTLFGAVFLWILTIATGQTNATVHNLQALTSDGWQELLYVVLIVGTVAYILYGFGLKRLPAGVSSAITFYPQVVFAALIQWLFLGIVPSWTSVMSALLILGGTGLMTQAKQTKSPVRKSAQAQK